MVVTVRADRLVGVWALVCRHRIHRGGGRDLGQSPGQGGQQPRMHPELHPRIQRPAPTAEPHCLFGRAGDLVPEPDVADPDLLDRAPVGVLGGQGQRGQMRRAGALDGAGQRSEVLLGLVEDSALGRGEGVGGGPPRAAGRTAR
ncbi:hypothetical protein C8E95_7188 [Pseudonocardia autotrophica]|uniref:Uncharacterized protein n=1 Tax=Pseudonocardia autotrophica TaxID=2074 RepID=A0A1Y2MJ80_PSEAH|nr:hypothetical protein BG845_06783 [Pseudonocardia autotrophica]TDN65403.1 hypothetical protein C8E95_6889 [Pseudonocardia autotrophica]TDN65675.1 hypothetical protein C8E95_7188 [Pseudonocardia autotrophica]